MRTGGGDALPVEPEQLLDSSLRTECEEAGQPEVIAAKSAFLRDATAAPWRASYRPPSRSLWPQSPLSRPRGAPFPATPGLSRSRTPQQVSPSRATRSPALPHTRPRHGQPLPDACAVSPHQSGPIPQFRHGSCNMRTSVLSSLSTRAGRKPAGVTVARPGSITPNGIMPQAYVEASLPNALRQRRYGWLTLLRPTVPLCHAVRHLCPELPTQALQNCARQPKLPARDCAECRGI